ncbi:hypothetical protein [Leuconostoc citreum]|uniref:hypothetical protein n=1 Tax=Leuconostoc citreum TaxID=33964 RepID=UPI00190FC49C|nr:hypothetical protein [Leuconostoc citreum]MCP1275472.1 hypothetical protein [Leuconostoc citreum]QQE97559.1 hypothetical protein LeuC0096_05145 [Leuconostoc citreum]
MLDSYYPNGMTRGDLQHVGELSTRYETRLEYLRNERSKSLDEIDQVNDYIHELDDEIRQLEFGDE